MPSAFLCQFKARPLCHLVILAGSIALTTGPVLAADPFFTLAFQSTSASSTNGGITGIKGEATYTFLSSDPGKMVLSLSNLSGSPVTSSRLVSTGFDLPTNPPVNSNVVYGGFVQSDSSWNAISPGTPVNPFPQFDVCASATNPADCDASSSPNLGLANGASTTVGTFTFTSNNAPLTTATQYRDAFVALYNVNGAPDGDPSAGQFPGGFFMRWKAIEPGDRSDKVWATSIVTGGNGGQAPGNAVPGPLPIFGAAAAFGYSRKLRRRLKAQAVIG